MILKITIQKIKTDYKNQIEMCIDICKNMCNEHDKIFYSLQLQVLTLLLV
jgi:hypothetical protein